MIIKHEILGKEVEKKITWELSVSEVTGSLKLIANGVLVLWISEDGKLYRHNEQAIRLSELGLKIDEKGTIVLA